MSDSKEFGKHTQGPWSIPHFADDKSACGCAYIFSESQSGFGAIATVQFGGEDEGYKTAKANALLISAAPDLLEALEWAMKNGRLDYNKRNEINKAYCDGVDKAKSAIDRARGLSQ